YLSGPVDGGDDPGVAHLEERRAVGPGDDADLALELPHLRDAGREESEPAELEPDEGEREGAGAHLVGAAPVDAESAGGEVAPLRAGGSSFGSAPVVGCVALGLGVPSR
ncbi:hypothetical protein ZWY2020_027002, partial [Hordeum vulgare]